MVMLVEEEGKMVDASAMEGLDELIIMLHKGLADSESVWKLFFSEQGEFIANALFHDPNDDDTIFLKEKSMDD
eukprot:13394666-Ditylum_brightwellii.AAC.1